MLIIHKASAGSGKTYTLTYQYIRLLLGEKNQNGEYKLSSRNNRHRAILAITFTNKATEEMKRRIVKQLSLLAGAPSSKGEKSDYESILQKDFNCSPDELRSHAAKALRNLLCDFTNFNVATIDSFFQTVLRTFAREASLTGNYDVELDDMNAIMVGINEMLSSINRITNEELERDPHYLHIIDWLKKYMSFRIHDGKTFNIFNRKSQVVKDIKDFTLKALSETYKLNAKAIDAYLDNPELIITFNRQLHEAEEGLKNDFFEFAKSTIPAIIENADNGTVKYINDKLDAWSNGLFPPIDSTKGYWTKRYKKGKEPDDSTDALLTSLIELAFATQDNILLYPIIKNSIYNLGLLGEIKRKSLESRNDNNAILLSDTNDILRRIINQEEAPFIYERMGVRLRHFLIDEFQDTSRLQWLNLSSLVRESLATDNDNLIIGDEKQSIYRFRNSDPDLIVKDVPDEFKLQSEIHGNTPEENSNWRSAPEIVRFNNTIFTYLAGQLDVEDIYSNVIQEVKKTDYEGYVKAFPYNEKSEAFESMLDEIKRQLDSGYRQQDIAILVNKNSEAEEIIQFLLNARQSDNALRDIRIMSEEALRISGSPAVKLIVSVMRYLDNHNTSSPDHAENDYQRMLRINTRFQYYLATEQDHRIAISKALNSEDAPEKMAHEAEEMSCVSLPSLVERIVVRYLNSDILHSENIFISAFQDLVFDFTSQCLTADLHSFLKWWDERGCDKSLDTPSDVQAIRVMTIHKSKGLEFPCVHIPLVDWEYVKSGTHASLVWFRTTDTATGAPISSLNNRYFSPEAIPPFIPLKSQKKLIETDLREQYILNTRKEIVDIINKTYVGFTRAVKELIIGYKFTESLNEISRVNQSLEEAFSSVSPEYCESVLPGSNLIVPLSDKVDGEEVFHLGTPTVNKKSEKTVTDIPVPDYYAYDNENLWALSRIEDIEEMERPRLRGIILHSVMTDIRHRDDVEKAVRRRAMKGFIEAGEVDDVIAQLKEALDDERVDRWFEGYTRLLNERPLIAVSKENEVCHYRPDRVVWTADGGIDVVDFKFGEEEPKSYYHKVRRYVSFVKRMFPGKVVRGYLWYPLHRHISMV